MGALTEEGGPHKLASCSLPRSILLPKLLAGPQCTHQSTSERVFNMSSGRLEQSVRKEKVAWETVTPVSIWKAAVRGEKGDDDQHGLGAHLFFKSRVCYDVTVATQKLVTLATKTASS